MRWFIALLLLAAFCQARELRLNLAQPATAGVSSWYGAREQGKKTASGERFDRHKMTCASRSYPLGTLLTVKYPAKGTFVIVRVNDRGPWVRGRTIDLSEQAAKVLGLRAQGVAYVEITPVHLWRNHGKVPVREIDNPITSDRKTFL
jgi:rare lipoprotein A